MSEPTLDKTRVGVLRRIIGISVDWTLSLVISAAFFPLDTFDPAAASALERVLLAGDPLATLGIWALQHVVLVSSIGTTIGHRLVGARVVADDGAPFVGLVKGAVRTVLLALVIPAVVWDTDGRGLHDRGAHTHLVNTRGGASA